MKTTDKTYFVISACLGKSPKVDAVSTDELEQILIDRGEVFGKVEGMWEGQVEESFLVESRAGGTGRDLTKAVLLELASVFGQTCIAEFDTNNSMLYLHYTTTGEEKLLGTFRQTTSKPAGDYTKIGDEYFVVDYHH